jgi:hypothetical protein
VVNTLQRRLPILRSRRLGFDLGLHSVGRYGNRCMIASWDQIADSARVPRPATCQA